MTHTNRSILVTAALICATSLAGDASAQTSQSKLKLETNTRHDYSVFSPPGGLGFASDGPAIYPFEASYNVIDPTRQRPWRVLEVFGTQMLDWIRVTSAFGVSEIEIIDPATKATLLSAAVKGDFDRIDVYGFAGDDEIRIFGVIPDRVFGGLGDDTIDAGDGPSLVYGQAGIDTIDGSFGSDGIYGGPGDDRLAGGPEADLIDGGEGGDILGGGSYPSPQQAASESNIDGAVDVIFGGPGGDRFVPTTLDVNKDGSENEDLTPDYDESEGDGPYNG